MPCRQHRSTNVHVDISVSLSLHGVLQRSDADGVDKMHIPWAGVSGLA